MGGCRSLLIYCSRSGARLLVEMAVQDLARGPGPKKTHCRTGRKQDPGKHIEACYIFLTENMAKRRSDDDYGDSCSLCFFPFNLHHSSCTQLIFFACDQRLALFFSFLSVSSYFTSSSSINDHKASSSSPLHSRAATTMCRRI
ncbi:hypothetical protein F2Q68_00040886 [Brassica cretica]|uniref:Uncharacterized protein n=1 Tax=Brassica cretica TaxID=69181 RepID=A0A8S9MSI9_BRACR|nr:hypothetical protein F2Q68_00040886 [Brassica cretica]